MLGTDIHCHLLPGLDHGSQDRAETMIMAAGLERLGVRRVNVTPHQFRFDNDLEPRDVRRRTGELQTWLKDAGLALEVHPGAEHYYGERLLDAVEHKEELLTWATVSGEGATEHLLVELPLREPVVGVSALAGRLDDVGLRAVLAHPERVVAVQRGPDRLRRWVESGWLLQLDLLSLVGAYGREARRIAKWVLAAGGYDFVGSDLHRPVQLGMLARAHAEYRKLSAKEADA